MVATSSSILLPLLLLLGWTILIPQVDRFVTGLAPFFVPCIHKSRNSRLNSRFWLSSYYYFWGERQRQQRQRHDSRICVYVSSSKKNNNDGDSNIDHGTEDDRKAESPLDWYGDVAHFVFVRRFVRADVSDDEITTRLQVHKIETFKDLWDNINCILDLVDQKDHKEFTGQLYLAYQRIRVPVEDNENDDDDNDNEEDYNYDNDEDEEDDNEGTYKAEQKVVEIVEEVSTESSKSDDEIAQNPVKSEKVDDNEHNNPKNWYSDTVPFVAARWFVRKDVSDDVIKKRLDANEIKTIADLWDKYDCMLDLMNQEERKEFPLQLAKNYQRIRFNVEELLGGQAALEYKCIGHDAFELFSLDAVSVIPDTATVNTTGLRLKNFTLVLGSSGSGKSLFALKRLPTLLFGQDTTVQSKEHFSVHLETESLGLGTSDPTRSSEKQLQESVTFAVNERISKRLQETNLPNVENVNLHLHVVIDEAGGESNRVFFDTATKINDLVDYIRGNLAVKFQKGVHVTVVGSGLEATTSSILTMTDTYKFRMQPWTLRNFEALVNKSHHPTSYKELVMQAVKKYPDLENIVSNGRCAYFLLRSMGEVEAVKPKRVGPFINPLIRKIADSYAKSNGLSFLKNSKDKFAVVRSVLRELDISTSKRNVAFFPQFRDLQGDQERLRSVAISFLEINVESSGGKLILVHDMNFSLSVSPALVLVMFNLLNTEGEVSWDWSGFESVVMLNELKQLVVKTKDIPSNLDTLVVRSPFPFPSQKSNTTCSVPAVRNCTVILNGKLAPYADVIAPFRLVQVKHSVLESTTIALDIRAELDKMGLTTTEVEKYKMKQAVTDTLYAMWEDEIGENPTTYVAMSRSRKRERRHACYPTDVLLGRRMVEKIGVVEVRINGAPPKKRTTHVKKDSIAWEGRKPFNKERPVEAVFATNCKAFHVKVIDTGNAQHDLSEEKNINDKTGQDEKKEGNATNGTNKEWNVLIGPNDVNWKGELLEGKELEPELIKSLGLRENVVPRFVFFESGF